jgi:two-component system chemotaxis response regulator CheY
MAPRILIVDDLPSMRERLERILSDADFEIAGTAGNGEQALVMYMDRRPDVVLLDIIMPGMDGISTLDALLRLDAGARIIMCSAVGEQRMIVRAIRHGAKDFVVKPFSEERVVSAVSKVLGANGAAPNAT